MSLNLRLLSLLDVTLSPLMGAIVNVSFNSDVNASLFTSDSDQCHLMMAAGVVPDDSDYVILSPMIVTVFACVCTSM